MEAIKARHNTDPEASCHNCGATPTEALDLFDLRVGKRILTLCDVCVGDLAERAVAAKCYTNGRTKSSWDVAKLRKRQQQAYLERAAKRPKPAPPPSKQRKPKHRSKGSVQHHPKGTVQH